MTSHRTSSTRPITKRSVVLPSCASSKRPTSSRTRVSTGSTAMIPISTPKLSGSVNCMSTHPSSTSTANWSSAATRRRGCRFCSANTRPNKPSLGKDGDASMSTSVMALAALLASFAVPTGEVAWNLGTTRTSDDFVAHLRHAANHFPEMDRYHWVLDNLNTHWSLPVSGLVAEWCDIPLDAKYAAVRQGTASVSELTENAQARVPFHAQARQLAQSGRTLVRGSRSPVPCTGRLSFC